MKTASIIHEFIIGLVSVVVPICNAEKYLHLCIDSVINQNYKNIEVLLINDGSTDNSGGICDVYAQSDNRIKVMHTKNNGPAAARNMGIENSKGEFIFFVDADDFIENYAISLLIENYKQHIVDLVIGDFKKIKNDIVEKRDDIFFLSDRLLTKKDIIDYARCYLKRPNKYLLFAFSWGRLFKSSIIKENNIFFNTALHTFEDVAFNFDYLHHSHKILFLKESIYNHIIHDDYISATMGTSDNLRKMFGYKQALINISDFLKNNITDAEIEKEVGHAFIFLTIIQLVRICRQLTKHNKNKIVQLIRELVNDSSLKGSLKFYLPSKSESKILPILIQLKLVWLIIRVCKHKAYKRYKKAEKKVV